MTDPVKKPERLFLAVWPDPGLAGRLYDLARRHVPAGQGRLVDARNIHLTLAFLGSVDASRQQCVLAAAGSGRPPSFPLMLDCLGYWHRSHVLWAGCSQTPAVLSNWVAELLAVVTGCGLSVKSRPFRAHLTLARHVRRYSGFGRGGKVAARMRRERVDDIAPLIWMVRSLTLVASDTRPQGARYRILHEWPLI